MKLPKRLDYIPSFSEVGLDKKLKNIRKRCVYINLLNDADCFAISDVIRYAHSDVSVFNRCDVMFPIHFGAAKTSLAIAASLQSNITCRKANIQPNG